MNVGERPKQGAGHLVQLPLDDVRPNPNQPRKVFTARHLEELIASIRVVGLIQPIIVRSVGEGSL